MTIKSPFQPRYGAGVAVAPAAASATSTLGLGNKTLRVRNTGATNIMFFRTGRAADGAVVATSADMPVSPGETVYVEKFQDHDTVAYISAAGTTAQIISGEGGMAAGS